VRGRGGRGRGGGVGRRRVGMRNAYQHNLRRTQKEYGFSSLNVPVHELIECQSASTVQSIECSMFVSAPCM
jgi:hypothetical protein